MYTKEEEELLKEYYKRLSINEATGLIDFDDPQLHLQNEVVNDKENRYKANQCTRRAGKSFTEVVAHINDMQTFPKCRNLYLALTADSAEAITYDIFDEINEKFKIGLVFKVQKRIWVHPNGSTCRMFGVDNSEKEMKKVLGQKLMKVSIDEAGSMTINMKKLVYQMIKPALADLRPNSSLTLLGTAENIPNTFFEAVTSGKEKDVPWKIRKWTAYDNPYMKDQWTEEINEMLESNPLVVNASWFKTHYMNEWCADDDLLIIPAKDIQFVKHKQSSDWIYVLGVDIGFNDANAFTVCAYSPKSNKIHFVKSYKEAELIFSEVAAEIKKLQRQYNITKIWIDGSNKQGVEEIKQRFKIPLESAEKTTKALMLNILKDDIVTGTAQMDEDGCGELFTEWQGLMWKDEQKDTEDPRCQNHSSDSALYAWRYCKHYLYVAPEKKHNKDSNEYMDELEKKEALEMEKRMMENQEDEGYY